MHRVFGGFDGDAFFSARRIKLRVVFLIAARTSSSVTAFCNLQSAICSEFDCKLQIAEFRDLDSAVADTRCARRGGGEATVVHGVW